MKRRSLQKFWHGVVRNISEFTVFMTGLTLCILTFQKFVGLRLFRYLVEYAQITDDEAGKFMLLIFTVSSSVLILLFYWMVWESRMARRLYSRYIAKLVVKDYYKEYRRMNVDGALSSLSRYQRQDLDADKDPRDAVLDGIPVSVMRIYFTANELIPPEKRTDGLHQLRYEDGSLKLEVSYKDGLYDGVYRTYYEGGRLHQEKIYKAGRLDGPFLAYDENGILYFEINYANDKQHGPDKIYNKNGVLQFCDIYEHGVRVNRRTYDERGRVIFSQDFDRLDDPSLAKGDPDE